MNKKRIFEFVIVLLSILLITVGSQVVTPVPSDPQSSKLLVAAAASLQDVLETLDPLFEATHSGISINYNFAASGPLQQQIEQGAPVDLFISAASRQMDVLQQKKLLEPNTRRNILSNELVLVVPRTSPLRLAGFGQLKDPNVRRISVGEPRSVPAGQYAEEMFKKLGLLEELRPKFVYGNSVRSILGVVESGNADAGVVYKTDARISNRVVQVATAPKNLHSPITYPMAIIAASRNKEAARVYAKFLISRQARDVFRKHGFGIPL